MTDAEAREVARAEVGAAGEEVLWSGRPSAGRLAARALPVALFALPFTAFSAFWIASAAGFRWPDLSQGGFALFPLFGVPFLAVGLLLLLAPLIAHRAARRTVYAVSRGGVWIVHAGRRRRVARHAVGDPGDRRVSVRADGSGDLVVARRALPERGGRLRFEEVTLVGIPDVRRVEGLVASLPRSAPAEPLPPSVSAGSPARSAGAWVAPGAKRPADRGRSGARAAVLAVAVLAAVAAAVVLRGRDAPPAWPGPARAAPPPLASAAPATVAEPPPLESAPPPTAAAPVPPASPAPVQADPGAGHAAPVAAAPAGAADALPPPPVRFASHAELCAGGDGAACFRAASELRQGGSGAADPAGAARLYARACELGQGGACRSLGWMLQGGAGLPQDRTAGAGWLVRGCELGDMEGCRGGGWALAYGDGVPADPRRAVPMLERACAAGGLPRACAALGDLLEKGTPAPDRARALEAYARGCSQRDGDCCARAARVRAVVAGAAR